VVRNAPGVELAPSPPREAESPTDSDATIKPLRFDEVATYSCTTLIRPNLPERVDIGEGADLVKAEVVYELKTFTLIEAKARQWSRNPEVSKSVDKNPW